MDLRDGRVETHETPAKPPAGVVRWVDLIAQDEASLATLRERFEFHPLALEDCATLDQRPKLEDYGDHLFLVTQTFHCEGEGVDGLTMQELHCFLGERYLVTVHAEPMGEIDELWRRATGDTKLLGKGADFVAYLIADAMVDDCFPVLDRISDQLEAIEDQVLTRTTSRDTLGQVFALKHHLVTMRRVLSPQREVFAALARREDELISERTAVYFRDVYDHLARLNESIEANRDLLGNALEAHLSSVSQRTNDVMKALTLMSAIFLPLAFVVGFFGQNFDNFPLLSGWQHNDGLMWVMLLLCVATPVTMLLWFRKKEWL
jgi:magnesium transporter